MCAHLVRISVAVPLTKLFAGIFRSLHEVTLLSGTDENNATLLQHLTHAVIRAIKPIE